MDPAEAAALVIFVATFALISAGRAAGGRIGIPVIAVAGGAAMIAAGILSPGGALASISWVTLELILGMMLLASALEASGFFELVSGLIIRASSTPSLFLVVVSLITALLSALILNDAVVLLLTPVIISSARRMGISPVPPLVLEALSSNIGSAATEVGNPQNAYIAGASGLSFAYFTSRLLPVAALSLIAAIVAVMLLSGRGYRSHSAAAPEARSHALPPLTVRIAVMLAVVASVFTLFYALPHSYLPATALSGGLAAALLSTVTSKGGLRRVAGGVDWGILAFFAGLFVLIGGVESSGLLNLIISSLVGVDPHLLNSPGGVALLSAILSNLVSNVPAVLLIAHVIGNGATPLLWLTLSSSSTLAGNATILGAAANVIVVRRASREGLSITLPTFAKYGLPVTLVSLAIALVFLAS